MSIIMAGADRLVSGDVSKHKHERVEKNPGPNKAPPRTMRGGGLITSHWITPFLRSFNAQAKHNCFPSDQSIEALGENSLISHFLPLM